MVPHTVLPTGSACSLITQRQLAGLLGSSTFQTLEAGAHACSWLGSVGTVELTYGPSNWSYIKQWFAHDACGNQAATYQGGVGSKALTCPGGIDVLSGDTGVELSTGNLTPTPSLAILTSLAKYILDELGL